MTDTFDFLFDFMFSVTYCRSLFSSIIQTVSVFSVCSWCCSVIIWRLTKLVSEDVLIFTEGEANIGGKLKKYWENPADFMFVHQQNIYFDIKRKPKKLYTNCQIEFPNFPNETKACLTYVAFVVWDNRRKDGAIQRTIIKWNKETHS